MHCPDNLISRRPFYIRTVIFIIITAFLSGCSVNEPGSSKAEGFSIQSEGVSSTEAWIRVKSETVNPQDIIFLQRNGTTVLSFCLSGKDTLICIDSLTPGIEYTYQAVRSTSKEVYTSGSVSIKTMDTTSHDFHFRSFVVCNRSSGLQDVAIINENDIWAVGDMYMNLPEGKDDYEPVGAVHWDGKEWKQVKLPAVISKYLSGFLTPTDVLAFSPNDIWFADGGVIHFDGNNVTKCYWIADFPGNEDSPILENGIRKLWGTSSSNIYAVGYKGAIAHFDGKKWHKIESNTDLDIQDVWGSRDPFTGEEIVLCVASNPYTTDGRKVLQIKNDKAIELPVEGLNYSLYSIWFRDMNKVYISGSASFVKNLKSGNEQWNKFSKNVTDYWSLQVKGNGLNDIFLAGAYGDICHFNGKTWRNYMGREVEMFYGNLYGMDMMGNTICAVGGTGREPIILLGQR